jgi:predicted XRE-type DNA-binding protein
MADTVEVGSTNVYADLGYPDAEALQRKASIAAEIARTIKAQQLTQEAAAELLGIDQVDIAKITRGQFRGTSETMMLEWIAKIGD